MNDIISESKPKYTYNVTAIELICELLTRNKQIDPELGEEQKLTSIIKMLSEHKWESSKTLDAYKLVVLFSDNIKYPRILEKRKEENDKNRKNIETILT